MIVGIGIDLIECGRFLDWSAFKKQRIFTKKELEYADTTFLSIDGFMRGTGTNTCGPDTLPKYVVKSDKPISFRFAFKGE